MKVLILQHGIFPGSVAPIGKEYAKNLHLLGVDVAVAVIGEISQKIDSEPLDFPVFAIDKSSIVDSYRKLKKIAVNYDIVHYFPSKGYEFLPLFIPNAEFIFNRLSVSVSGNVLKDKLINFLKRVQPLFAKSAIFTDTQLAFKLRPFPEKPVFIMPVGYPSDLFYACPPNECSNEKVLIYHGAVRPQRELDKLVHVLGRLPPEYKLSIIGGGLVSDDAYRDHLGTLAKQIGCYDRINLTNMPQSYIRSEIEKAYMGLSYVPMWDCYQDQFVLKTIEYLACNRPVLTTATRYSKKFSEDIGNDMILLSDGSVEDMVDKIVGSEEYVNNFYRKENILSLNTILRSYSTEYLVKTRLLDIYSAVLTR